MKHYAPNHQLVDKKDLTTIISPGNLLTNISQLTKFSSAFEQFSFTSKFFWVKNAKIDFFRNKWF